MQKPMSDVDIVSLKSIRGMIGFLFSSYWRRLEILIEPLEALEGRLASFLHS